MQANLTTLLTRLEAATSRLEDIATASYSQTLVAGNSPQVGAGAEPARAQAAAVKTAPVQQDSPAVEGYAHLMTGQLSVYVKSAQAVGGAVEQQATLVQQAFQAQHAFIQVSARSKKPSTTAFPALLKDTQAALSAVQNVQDTDRTRKYNNILKTVSEGIAALGWVTVEPTPGPYVKDMKEGSEFYANRAIKEFKESNPSAVELIRAFMKLLDDLRAYVLQFHTTGVAWNPKGEEASAPASAPSNAAPTQTTSAKSSPAPTMGSVFAQLSKGEGVTTGLKKVDDTQKTHKNPSLRGDAPAPAPATTSPQRPPVKGPKPGSFAKKSPITELQGNKWIVENHDNNPQIVIEETAINQTVNLFGCKSSTIQIKGKVNAVSVVSCTKLSILMDSAVSTLSITSSPSFAVQITGKVPTITIDATDGGQIYLSDASLETEIITAKCSALNISLPVKGEEAGIYTEKPIPEQLKTVIESGKLVTSVVEHSG